MPWGAVAGAVIGAVGSSMAASKQSSAAKQAAQAQTDAANQANQTQLKIFQQQQAANEPFRQNGLTAQAQYMRMLGLTPYQTATVGGPTDYQAAAKAYLAANPDVAADPYYGTHPFDHYQQYGQAEGRAWGVPASQTQQSPQDASAMQQQAFDQWRNTPGYQFGLNEGVRALDSSAAASGGLFSGQAGKTLFKYGNDYADQQGYNPYMNKLASLAGMAQTATRDNAQAGQDYATAYGHNVMGAGDARASGLIGGANAWGQSMSTIGALAGGALNQWSSYRNNGSNMFGGATSSAPSYTNYSGGYQFGAPGMGQNVFGKQLYAPGYSGTGSY